MKRDIEEPLTYQRLSRNTQQRQIEKLLTYQSLSEVIGLPVRTLRTLKYRGLIPHISLGHRSVFFNPTHVSEALRKREVREI